MICNQEIMGQNKMQNELQLFYRNLFKSNCTNSYDACIKFIDNIVTLVLAYEKTKFVQKIWLKVNCLNHKVLSRIANSLEMTG